MTRSRSASLLARWGLLVLLAVGNGPAAWAQPGAGAPSVASDSAASQPAASQPAPAPAAPKWPWVLALLGGIALGVLGSRMLSKSGKAAPAPIAPVPAPVQEPIRVPQRKPAENVVRTPVQSAPEPPRPAASRPAAPVNPKPAPNSAAGGKAKKNKPNQPARPNTLATSTTHSAAMNPSEPQTPANAPDQPLEIGQTVEWSAKPTIHELMDTTANDITIDRDARVESLEALEAAAAASAPAAGPLQFYGPAPDVPSIEHRKLSPNPLPQMPLLVTLASTEASTAQFSFSPQADQSRIIGNGVRELKEFFQFELPPAEQFTTIKNLKPGKLEKRDDTWHVVEKASIALS